MGGEVMRKKFISILFILPLIASMLHYELGCNINKSTLNFIGSHEHIFGRAQLSYVRYQSTI